jgi:uncharacterized protein YqgV (UPF0045/DUF77 family)
MLVAFSVAPSGGSPSDSVHDAVAAAVQVVRDSGLPNHTDSMFTTIEGGWDECLAVVRDAVEAVGAYGSRVSLVLKADIRPGHTGELTGKLDRLEAALARRQGSLDAVEGVAPEWAATTAESTGAESIVAPEGAAEWAAGGSPRSPRSARRGPPARSRGGTRRRGGLAAEGRGCPVAASVPGAAGRPGEVRATAPVVTVRGDADDDLPIACAVGARILVAESAPPESLGLVEFSRDVLRTSAGVRVVSGDDEAWRGQAADTTSVVVWTDSPDAPIGVWVQVSR